MSEALSRIDPDAPVACSLPADEQQLRRADLREGLLAHLEHVDRLRDGALLYFSSKLGRPELEDFAAFERSCCGFARFEVGGPEGAHTLSIRGPEGTRDFLASWLPEPHAAKLGSDAPAGSGNALARARPWSRIATLGGAGLLLCCIAPALGAFGLIALAAALAPWLEWASVIAVGAAGWLLWRSPTRIDPREDPADCGC